MSKFAFGGLALALAAGGALAADLPGRRAAPAPVSVLSPVPVYNWTGFYAGVNGGADFATYTSRGRSVFKRGTGGLIGGTLGYNYQVNQFVVGVEGDFDYSGIGNKRTLANGATTKATVSSLATVRARAGFAADRALVYVTGGYAGGNVKASINDPANAIFASRSDFRSGYVLGAGIEYAFTNNISAKAEYDYISLGKKTVFPGADATSFGANVSVIKAGLNYKF